MKLIIFYGYCKSSLAPRLENEFIAALRSSTVGQKGYTIELIESIYGPLRYLLQVGPYESMLAVDNGYIDPKDEFMAELKWYGSFVIVDPKGWKLETSNNYGHIYRLKSSLSVGKFDKDVIIKVINLEHWKLNKDKFISSDDIRVELDAHRSLCRNLPSTRNIVEYKGTSIDQKQLFYYQEAGCDLFDFTDRNRKIYWKEWLKVLRSKKENNSYYRNNISPWENLGRSLFRGIFQAVGMMHDLGYTHRDLKLENLVVCGEAPNMVGKLIDFGMTLQHGTWERKSFPVQGHVGTPIYRSPENQYNKNRTQRNNQKFI
eukprot:UN24781